MLKTEKSGVSGMNMVKISLNELVYGQILLTNMLIIINCLIQYKTAQINIRFYRMTTKSEN